jgi:Domain of unknown function (DUF397)
MPASSQENELNRLNWRKSARSVNNGNCTEVASASGTVIVRDSMDPETLVLRYSARSWASFLDATRQGRYDSIG